MPQKQKFLLGWNLRMVNETVFLFIAAPSDSVTHCHHAAAALLLAAAAAAAAA